MKPIQELDSGTMLENKVDWLEKNLAKLEESVKVEGEETRSWIQSLVSSIDQGLQRQLDAMGAIKDTIERLALPQKLDLSPRLPPPAPEKGESSRSQEDTQKVAARELYEGWAATPDASEAATPGTQLRGFARDDGCASRRRGPGRTVLRRVFFGACSNVMGPNANNDPKIIWVGSRKGKFFGEAASMESGRLGEAASGSRSNNGVAGSENLPIPRNHRLQQSLDFTHSMRMHVLHLTRLHQFQDHTKIQFVTKSSVLNREPTISELQYIIQAYQIVGTSTCPG
ncbi:hypothetical protein H6P81_017236 [Aristolochia fimbriata]|uniref:Uncharacterized protein n=1 Tax=Aristolochia fimbriata TaxID=158543 RepID=A0AAV7DXS9_ARIFI|nr:hypothetical protein H6P81_017236 [Aristolochia fimbriata]